MVSLSCGFSYSGAIFAETFAYDPAGNILRATRRNDQGAMMDDLSYFYDPARRHNRLRGVHDEVTGSLTGDLPSQMAHEGATPNYTYDASGNLISDTQGGLSTISWNLAGKLRSVTRADGQMVTYRYDAAGQRVAQTEGGNTTFYLRDASGNVMALYQGNTLSEHHLYGSSRLGTRRQGEAPRTLTLGLKSYELGNVMAVVSDHKLPYGTSWRAQLQSRTDYYAFGAAMPGRSGGSPYRHGLNGQEKGGLFNGHYTALYWEYDSRLGRRWNVDPKPNASTSNYAVFNANPIRSADPLGDTIVINLFNRYDMSDENAQFLRAAENIVKVQKDDGVFIIMGHGSPWSIANNYLVTDLFEHINLIDQTNSFRNALDQKKPITLILYSCNADAEEFVDNSDAIREDKKIKPKVYREQYTIAKIISKFLPKGSKVIAANGYVYPSLKGQPVQETTEKEPVNTGKGGYFTIQNGKRIAFKQNALQGNGKIVKGTKKLLNP